MIRYRLQHTNRPSLCLTLLAVLLFLWPAQGDIVQVIDGQPVGGQLTLEQGADKATVTDAEGNTNAIALMNIDEVRFGEKLVVLRDGNLLLINNDKAQSLHRMTGSLKLRAGLHRFVVAYWQGTDTLGLKLHASGPQISGEIELGAQNMLCLRSSDEEIEPSLGIDQDGYRLPELGLDVASDRRRFLNRSRYRFYIGDDSLPYENMSVLRRMELKRSGTTTEIGTGLVTEPNTHIGLVFEAFFIAKEDGIYTFALTSDDGSQLYFGQVERFQADELGQRTGPTPWRAQLKQGGQARGELTAIADETATFNLPLGDEQSTPTTLSLSQIDAIWDARVSDNQFNRTNEPADQDTVYIRGKEDPTQIQSVSGKVQAMDEQALTFLFRGQERKITRDRVAGLVFADSDRPALPSPGFYQTLRFRSGQVLPCNVVSIGDRVVFKIIGGDNTEAPRSALISMRSENGRRIDLTRIDPTAQESIPFFGLTIPHRVNQSFAGGPIKLYDENTYDRGLAVHSKSRLYYKLDRPCEQFRATFGLMDPGGKLGDVTARILGDGEVLWQQENITAATGAVPVEVALAGVQRLVLEVDFGGGQDVGDRAAWCNPELIFAAQE